MICSLLSIIVWLRVKQYFFIRRGLYGVSLGVFCVFLYMWAGLFIFTDTVFGATVHDLRIVEFMADPTGEDAYAEWIELMNTTTESLSLSNWSIDDGHTVHTFSSSILIAPGRAIVICHNNDIALNGGVACDDEWTEMNLDNTSGSIILKDEIGTVIDMNEYTGVDVSEGVSTTISEDGIHSLSSAGEIFGIGGLGTPAGNTVFITTHAYPTIQYALDHAHEGDVIFLGDGVYEEDIHITTPNITLLGNDDDPSRVVVRGVSTQPQSTFPDTSLSTTIAVSASGVTIHGIRIESPNNPAGYYSSGIVVGAQNIQIYNNHFVSREQGEVSVGHSESAVVAIQTAYHTEVGGLLISGNDFFGTPAHGYYGVRLRPSDDAGVVTISQNTFSGMIWQAIDIERSFVTVSGNSVQAEDYGQSWRESTGIGVDGNVNTILITLNTINGVGTLGTGIRIGSLGTTVTDFVMRDNMFHNNGIGILNASNWNNSMPVNDQGDMEADFYHFWGNSVHGNDIGMQFDSGFGIHPSEGSIENNSIGMVNNDEENPLNISHNWWGDASGPFHPEINPEATGDAVQGAIDTEGLRFHDNGKWWRWHEFSFHDNLDFFGKVCPLEGISVCLSHREHKNFRNISLNKDYVSISQAIAEAQSGDVIIIYGGTFHVSVVIPSDKQLTFVSSPTASINTFPMSTATFHPTTVAVVNSDWATIPQFEGVESIAIGGIAFNHPVWQQVAVDDTRYLIGASAFVNMHDAKNASIGDGEIINLHPASIDFEHTGLIDTVISAHTMHEFSVTVKNATGIDPTTSLVLLIKTTHNGGPLINHTITVVVGEEGGEELDIPLSTNENGILSLEELGGITLEQVPELSTDQGVTVGFKTVFPAGGYDIVGELFDEATLDTIISFDPIHFTVVDSVAQEEGDSGSLSAGGAGIGVLPAGMHTLTLSNNDSLNVSEMTIQADEGAITIGENQLMLDDFTSGTLSGKDMSGSIEVGEGSIVVTQALQIQSGEAGTPVVITNTDFSGHTLSIPDRAVLLAPATWDGILLPPTGVPESGTPPVGFRLSDTIIEVGSSASLLLFDTPVTITLPDVSGRSVAYKSPGHDEWVIINRVCSGTFVAPVNPEFPHECVIHDNQQSKIITYHLTSFAVVTSEPAPTGGGGDTTGSSQGSVVFFLTIPRAVSVIIDNGAETTTTPTVVLEFEAEGANRLTVSNTSDFAGSVWEPFTRLKQWTLLPGYGLKTVYVKYLSETGGISDTVSDTVIFQEGTIFSNFPLTELAFPLTPQPIVSPHTPMSSFPSVTFSTSTSYDTEDAVSRGNESEATLSDGVFLNNETDDVIPDAGNDDGAVQGERIENFDEQQDADSTTNDATPSPWVGLIIIVALGALFAVITYLMQKKKPFF